MAVLVLAYKMGAKEPGVFTKAEWVAGLSDIGWGMHAFLPDS